MQPMVQMTREFKWMEPKYGTLVRPWQISVEFDNNESEEGQFKTGGDSAMKYSYTLRSASIGHSITERTPDRWVDLQNPNSYRGQLGLTKSSLWLNTDQVWNVNGCVFKADGNFLNHFFFDKIGATPIFLGSYPSH